MSAFDEVSEVLSEVASQAPEMADYILREALPRVNTMLQLEDRGWTDMMSGITEGDDTPGANLEHVKGYAALIQEMTVGSPLISRGMDLRQSYVWSKGVIIDGAPDRFAADQKESKPKRRGPKNRKERFFADPAIRRYLLSSEAQKEMESSAFTEGHFFFLGDDNTRSGHPIPISEIDAVYLNPDYSGEVWAYRRSYKTYTPDGKPVPKVEWIYVDTFTGTKSNPTPDAVRDGAKVTVATDKTLFVKTFNTMVGWPIGVPDAVPAVKWAKLYAEMVNDGKVVSKANAKFVYKAKSNTAQGAQNVAAKASQSQGVGNIAAMGNNNELTSIPQSNRAYDFNGLRPIAAQVATALNVSVVHILSDPGAAGSSYGSASNLDLPTKRAMVSRQAEWVEYLERILEWGTGETLKVAFPSLDDPDPYREGQLLTMIWNAGISHADEIRPRMLEVGGITPLHAKAPTGIMLPNNEKSLNRGDVDNDSTPTSSSSGGSVPSTAKSPDQGSKNGTGGVSDSAAKDLRNEAAMNALMDRLEEVSRQLEDMGRLVESRGYLDK